MHSTLQQELPDGQRHMMAGGQVIVSTKHNIHTELYVVVFTIAGVI